MKVSCLFFLIIFCAPVYAWSGYDYEKGAYVDIDKGNLVRSGKEIEIFDYSKGEYKEVEVQSIRNAGSTTEVEVYDPTSNEYRTLEMDKR